MKIIIEEEISDLKCKWIERKHLDEEILDLKCKWIERKHKDEEISDLKYILNNRGSDNEWQLV